MLTARAVPNAAPLSAGVGEIDAGAAAALTSPPNPNENLYAFVAPDENGTPSLDADAWNAHVAQDASWTSASWTSASWTSASWTSASWTSASWTSASWTSAAHARCVLDLRQLDVGELDERLLDVRFVDVRQLDELTHGAGGARSAAPPGHGRGKPGRAAADDADEGASHSFVEYRAQVQQPMSVPAVADGAGWQSKRVRRLEPAAWAYSWLVFLVAAVAAVIAVATAAVPTSSEWVEFALLAPLAALAPLLSVSIGRNHSFHTGAAFIVAGAIVLPAPLVVVLAIVLHLPEWAKERYPWYMQGFNIANYTISGLAAWSVATTIGSGSDLRTAVGGTAAAATFVLVNHGLLAGMLKLARGHSVRESGLFSSISFGTDLVLATLGLTVAAFVVANPWLLPALLAPLLLAHRSLSVVALLRGSEERFRTMFESAATATLLIGANGRILTANRAAEELFKLDLATLTRIDTDALLHPDEAPADDLDKLLRGEQERYRAERRLVDADGAVIFARLAVSLVRDANTQPQYAIAMIEDVTEQHELAERLRQAQKLEAIGRLAGGVAHDFNNMLTAIGGYNTFALERTEPGTPLHEDLHEIRKATERATLLTRQLLAFSRKQILQPELLNLNAVILELESMLRPLIGEDVVLTTKLDPALGPIEADPGQLQQVLMNLVVNARDAMPGGGTIVIETANAEVGDDSAHDRGRPLRDPDGAGHRSRASTPRPWSRSSSPSSPRRRPARARASGSRRCTGSSSRAEAMSPSRASRTKARPSRCTCAATPRRGCRGSSRRRTTRCRSRRRTRPRRPCSSSRTRRSCAASSGRCSRTTAITCSRRTTARSRSSSPVPHPWTCSSPTS